MQELRDSTEAKAIRPGGFELPALTVSSEDMAGFSRLGKSSDRSSARDREQEMFGGGFSFAQSGAADIYSAPGKSEKQITAQNFEYQGPPTLVPPVEGLDQMWRGVANLEHEAKHLFRGSIGETMNAIPDQVWSDAYKKFPQFKENGISEKQATELMKAIARNELFFYDLGDLLDDKSMRETGKPMQYPLKERKAGEATLGVSQVSVNGVKKFESEFPSQFGQYAGREIEALLDPKQAPMMIAAVLAHNIRDYKGHYAINEGSLAYSFNPDVPGKTGKKPPTDETLRESSHYANVMRQLAIIRGQVQPKPDEH